MAFQVLSGVPQLDKRLADLGPAGRRAGMKALRKSGNLIARKARLVAPVGKSTNRRQQLMGGRYGVRLKASVKVRSINPTRKSVVGLKVSVGAKHGHLVTLGTQFRVRKRIGGFLEWKGPGPDPRNRETGLSRPRPFFRYAYIATRDEARKTMIETMAFEVEKAWIQSKKAT